ncbi:hypothetical protein JCM10020v2_002628 [Rhodotorula toruloides]
MKAQGAVVGVAQIELPKDRELVEGAPTYLTGAVKNLKATIKPPRIPGAAYLSPVHDDFAILARLPKLKTLIVVVKSFLGDKRTSEFGVSTVDINLSAESPLRRLDDLCIVSGILNFPATTDKAPLALKRLALCAANPASRRFSPPLSSHISALSALHELVDQLDFLQFEDHHGEMTPVGWYTSNAPTLCMANSEAAHLDKAVFLPANLGKFFADDLNEICKAIEVPVVTAEDGHIDPRTDEERDELKKRRETTHDEFDFDEAEWMYRTEFITPAFVKYIQSNE